MLCNLVGGTPHLGQWVCIETPLVLCYDNYVMILCRLLGYPTCNYVYYILFDDLLNCFKNMKNFKLHYFISWFFFKVCFLNISLRFNFLIFSFFFSS